MTHQRRTLIETIQAADGHLDAASLLEAARKRDSRIDRATVYRTLELLKKLRLIDELDLMHLNGEKHFYEVKTNVDHVHLACFECGTIEEFTSPIFERLKSEIARQNGFHIRVIRLEVGGRCRRCCERTQTPSDCGESECCRADEGCSRRK
jgi:Fur family ferric uptake transcriptional regulator